MYLTKTGIKSGCDRPVEKRVYFLARFFGFAFGVNGSGGLLSRVRTRSSVRRRASAGGSKSIDLSSAVCCLSASRRLFIIGYDSSLVNALSFPQDRHEYRACLTPTAAKVGSGLFPVLRNLTPPQ